MGHEDQSFFVPLLVVTALAFLVPLLLSRVKRIFIPIVVGEIVGGMLVGESGLGLVRENPVLQVLSAIGFVYLMFLSGLEIDFSELSFGGNGGDRSRLKAVAHNPLLLGGIMFLLTLVGSAAAAFLLQRLGVVEVPWIMALILSTTSLGVVMPVLKEQGLTGSSYGQSLIVSSLIADFATVLLISVYVLLRSEGLTLELLLILVLFAAFVVVYRLAGLTQRRLPAERVFDELSSATSQFKLRGAFALALVFVALAQSLGIENILGAFLAGVIVSMLSSHEGSDLREKLDVVGYGFFIPIFFIMVGVGFDLGALLGSPRALLLVPLLVVIAYLVKLIPALVYKLRYSWRQTLAAGTLLSSRLSLIIAAAAVGLELGVISTAVNSAVILIAVITCVASPILFNRLVPRQEELPRVLVVGDSRMARLLTHQLRKHELDAVLVPGANDSSHDGRPSGPEHAASRETLSQPVDEADLQGAAAVVVMQESDEDNLRICRLATEKCGVRNVVCWIRNPARSGAFRELGVRTVDPDHTALLAMEGIVLNPGAFTGNADVDQTQEVRLRNPDLIGTRLSDLTLPEEVVALVVERDGNVLFPDQRRGQDIVLQANDVVTLVGTDGAVEDAARIFA